MSSVGSSSLTPAELQALLNGPALAPPPGVTSDFEDPPNKVAMAYAIYSTCFALGSLFVLLRIYGTWFCTKKAYISDYIMVLAYCFYTAFMAIIFCQVRVGYFVHQWDFRLSKAIDMFYLFAIATNLFAVSIMLIKAAILLEWVRIFVPRGTRNYFYWISMALLCVDVLFYSAGIITVNLTCIPHEKIWNPLVPGHCIDSKSVDITSAAINFVIDVIVLILPQRVIWSLSLSFEKRLGVSAVFAVGFLACFAAGFRLAVTLSYSVSADTTYTFCTVGVWVGVELTCGLIVLCMPSIPKALTDSGVIKIYENLRSWTRESLIRRSNGGTNDFGSSSGHSYKKRLDAQKWQELHERLDTPSAEFGPDSGLANVDEADIELVNKPAHTNATILRTTQIGITTEDRNHCNAVDSLGVQSQKSLAG